MEEIPKMTRSNLHSMLELHGLSRLPKEDFVKKGEEKFQRLSYRICADRYF